TAVGAPGKDEDYDYNVTKRPRPEIAEELKSKKPKRAEIPKPWLRDPQVRRLYNVRRALIVIAVLILIFSIILSVQNYLQMSNRKPSLEENAYDFMRRFREYDELTLDSIQNSGQVTWDADKFLKLTSEDIISDFETDFEFLIEVYDLSDYQVKYNRTLDNKLLWNSTQASSRANDANDNGFEISSYVNIFVTYDEVHLARIEITVWE
ncbi:hypothetical protein, partial [[Eubacterium] cellulosolvens]